MTNLQHPRQQSEAEQWNANMFWNDPRIRWSQGNDWSKGSEKPIRKWNLMLPFMVYSWEGVPTLTDIFRTDGCTSVFRVPCHLATLPFLLIILPMRCLKGITESEREVSDQFSSLNQLYMLKRLFIILNAEFFSYSGDDIWVEKIKIKRKI